jgi:CRISPR/Cas system CMR-associated protein Cmr1 (group 7 of RAMP superfamily)
MVIAMLRSQQRVDIMVGSLVYKDNLSRDEIRRLTKIVIEREQGKEIQPDLWGSKVGWRVL